jgi:hypothetical protein
VGRTNELLTPYSVLKIPDATSPISNGELARKQFENINFRLGGQPFTGDVGLTAFARSGRGDVACLAQARVDFTQEGKPLPSLQLHQTLDKLEISLLLTKIPEGKPDPQLTQADTPKLESVPLALLTFIWGRRLDRVCSEDVYFSKSQVFDSFPSNPFLFETPGDVVETLVQLNSAVNRARRAERRNPALVVNYPSVTLEEAVAAG